VTSESAEAYKKKGNGVHSHRGDIESPKEKAAMLQIALWWKRLAEYARGVLKPPSASGPI